MRYVPMDSKDVVDEAAARAGVSEELMRKVVEEYWNAVDYYLRMPFESKGGVYLRGLGRFEVSPRSLVRKLHSMAKGSAYTDNAHEKLVLLEQLLEYGDERMHWPKKINFQALEYAVERMKTRGINLRNDSKTIHYKWREILP